MGGHGKPDATATLHSKGADQNKHEHEDEFGVMKADDAKKAFVPSHGITSAGAAAARRRLPHPTKTRSSVELRRMATAPHRCALPGRERGACSSWR
jgi:hypothetical protein